ncbi:NADPH-dependent FMN reductase [Streptomyces sp. NPDC088387]|uniref:NADPH-dependent FMN reductase n=1 Tax=Streptomyces sp. NPDC088387 TaxID=3365859 RepID=UPI003824FE86
MLKVGIIVGSTRPNRVGRIVGDWVATVAAGRDDAEFTLVDLLDVDLPLLDEGMPPLAAQYTHQHTKDWAATVADFDAFLIVSGEYNHSIPAALKNALDFVYAEWNNKAAGFVTYGADSGIRAVEHLRTVLAELQVATVREQVALNSYTDFENFYEFHPTARHEAALNRVIDQVLAWGGALRSLR